MNGRNRLPVRGVTATSQINLAPASFIDPALPMRADRAPAAEGCVHVTKHRLYTMTGVDWMDRYPWIVQDVARSRSATPLLMRSKSATATTA
jgi:hypothetical protein